MKYILQLPFKVFCSIFGEFNWSPPNWLRSLNNSRRDKPLAFWGVCVAMVLGLVGYTYYLSLPAPITLKAEIQSPGITEKNEEAKPQNVYVDFVYDLSRLKKEQSQPAGPPSVARIDLVGEEITKGIGISPAKKGKWMWLDDRRIQFEPESDWPAGTEYTLSFTKEIFLTDTKLSANSYSFVTPDLDIVLSNIEFYQDPQDSSVRRVVSTMQFSHPVDQAALAKKVSMSMRPSGQTIAAKSVPFRFEVSLDKYQREAYILSEPVALPNEPNYMKISLESGLTSVLGGKATGMGLEEKILIPDVYSFLKVTQSKTEIVRNQKDEPEQILMLEFTDDIDERELLGKLSFHLLPQSGETAGKNSWSGPREVSKKVLANSKKIDMRLIPNEKKGSKLYNFVFDLPERRYLYMKIAPGLSSVNQFIHASFYDAVLQAPKYPKEVDISGDGSILTYSGEHKLSVLSRGLPALKYKIGRVLEGQLYHLITQSDGNMKSPSFHSGYFNSQNISEYLSEIVDIRADHPQAASYSSLDLSNYLPQKGDRFGLFFVEVKGWNRKSKREIYGAADRRLILVTDLGLIVKNNADSSHDVFVQSIKTGIPVDGAKVELLGKNGIALYERFTSVDGHVTFPPTKDFRDEKAPSVYVVREGSDISFIPFSGGSRQINLSRFDIGGVSSSYYKESTLNAYAFTDRGIYRPGETVNIGCIVKNVDLSNVVGIPLEVVIRGPRYNEVKVQKFSVAENGMFDVQYITDPTSATGYYTVSIHLIRDQIYRGQEIGTTSFNVEDFQPDTMKISSRLGGVSNKGWSTQSTISANTELKNLFGIAAQNRKITGRLIIKPAQFRFKEYRDYSFTSPFLHDNGKPLSVDEMLETQMTDADGLATFVLNLQRFREGTYDLQFIAEGFDQAGGRSVIASNGTLISPLDFLIGYKADGDLTYISANSKRSVEFIAIDTSLSRVSKQGLSLRYLQIQHVSTLVKQGNGTFRYQSVQKEKELDFQPLEIPQENYKYAIDTATPGDFAIEIYDGDKRRLTRVEFSVVGHGNLAGRLDKNADLQLKLNKTDYRAGEQIEMNIKAPYAGAGLITIETDRVHHFEWFNSSSESSLQAIRIPDGLEGSAYVNVAFVRDIGSKEIFTSPLSYAVAPFSIDKSNREIKVNLGIKEIVRPGRPMEIHYQTSVNSKIVVFAVDDGILQVAQYQTPAPLDHFLKKRALDVETLQILDLILPEFNLLKELSASGGGASAGRALAKNLNPFARKTDRPAVYWSGILDAGPQQQKVVFDVPDTFAGSLTVFAVAVAEESMGVSSDSVIVRGPFVISPNVLTEAAPGDEFLATVGVANLIHGSGKGALVEVDIKTSAHLELLDSSAARLNIDEGSEGKLSFRLKVLKSLGSATITLTAKHKEEISSRSVSLSVRPAMPYYTSLEAGFVKGGQTELVSARNLYADLANQSVAASASPLVLVDGLTSYLKNYPHGCTEQVVSKVFPLVGLMTHPAYAPHLENVQSHFSHVIDKLRERQLSDGGFAFWPGHANSAEYPSIYVMHFLVEASQLGYQVPNDMLERGSAFLSSYVARPAKSLAEARDRANGIYLLTRLGRVTTNFLVDLQEYLDREHKKTWQKDLTASYMAATYKLLQKDNEADRLVAGYKLGGSRDTAEDDFHSNLSQDAQHIFLLSKHFPDLAKGLAGDQLLQLTDKIFKGEYNTISSAYSILALGAYSTLALQNNFDEKISFTAHTRKGGKESLKPVSQPFSSVRYGVDTQLVDLKADFPLYYLNTQSGFDSDFPEKAVNDGIEIIREYLDDEGNKLTTFEQGEEITVRLRVRALQGKHLNNIAIIDLLPGGFEVVRSSVSRTAFNWRADYIDIREDRVIFYGAFDSSVRDLIYKVKLTSAGKFIIPPSYAESMYDRSIRSMTEAGTFTVTASK